jgi:hypothetical protein
MFGVLRRHTKTIVTVLISLIIPAFVLWGVSSAIIARKASFAGNISGERVDIAQYNQSLAACQFNAMLTYGDNYEKIAKYLNLQNAAWERLALIRSAHKSQIIVSDTELVNHIQNYSFFKHNGIFSKERYYLILSQALKITPEQFEKRERNSLLVQKRVRQVKKSVFLSDNEVFDAYRILKEQVKVAYVQFPFKNFTTDTIDKTPELQVFFDKNATLFTRPVQRKISYVHINPSEMPSKPASEEELKAYYEENKELYRIAGTEATDTDTKPQTVSYQPFKTVKADIAKILKTNQQEALAQVQANAITEDLLDELPLETIAKTRQVTFHDSPYFAQGKAIPGIPYSHRLSQEAFRLKENQSSDILSISNSLYVIKVTSEKDSYTPLLDEVINEVKDTFRMEQAKNLAKIVARDIRTTLTQNMKASQTSFIDAAKELKLEVIQPDPFTQNALISTGLGYSPIFNKESFALEAGQVSEPLATTTGIVLLPPIERISTSKKTFLADKTKDDFAKQVLNQKQILIYNTWLKQLKDQAKISPNPKYFP